MQSKTADLNLIARAYAALEFLNDQTFTSYREVMRDMCEAEERQHRIGSREGWGITVKQAAQLFVVQWITRYLTEPKTTPKVADVLRLKPSCIYAAALVATYRVDIRLAFKREHIEPAAVLALDYCRLVEVPQREAA